MARSRFVKGPKRKSLWLQFVPVGSTLTAPGGFIYFSLNSAALALRPFTIVRTRFIAMIRSDQTSVGEDQLGAMGIAVVSDQAVDIGITAVPTPLTDMGSSLWFTHEMLMNNGSKSADGGGGGVFQVDSQAMRKVEVGQDLVVVGEQSTVGQGFGLFLGGRILVKTN